MSHDLINGILYGKLKQIRLENDIDPEIPEFIQVWTCEFDPRTTKVFLSLIKNVNDETELKHLKRLVKTGDCIKGILCTSNTKFNIELQFNNAGFKFDNLQLKDVPKQGAKTLETTVRWGEQYWPLNWKGNSNHQYLNKISFNIDHETSMIEKLLLNWTESAPSVSIFTNGTIELVETTSSSKPLDHSIMKCIAKIANNELYKRKNHPGEDVGYLCNDFNVYTTHEPCVMCSMALVHSRINRIIYLRPVPHSGGLESTYYLGDKDGLNWKFQIWRWLGERELEKLGTLSKTRPSLIEY